MTAGIVRPLWFAALGLLVVGSGLLLAYACRQRDPVLVLAAGPILAFALHRLYLATLSQGRRGGRRQRRTLLARCIRGTQAVGFLVEYAAAAAAYGVLRALPRRSRLAVGEVVGLCAYYLRLRRSVLDANLAHTQAALPDRHPRQLAKAVYRTVGRYMVDYLTFDRNRLPPIVIEDTQPLLNASSDARGALLIGAHVGSWELLIHVLRQYFPNVTVVAKPMRNPWVERWLTGQRLGPGVALVPPTHALRRTLRVIQRGSAAAYLVDQYPGHRGLPSIFLGRPALTIRSAAGIACMTGCRVVAGYAILETDGVYHMTFAEIPNPPVPKHERREMTTRYVHDHNQIVSRWIQAHPEHWFGWFHRRFRGTLTYAVKRGSAHKAEPGQELTASTTAVCGRDVGHRSPESGA